MSLDIVPITQRAAFAFIAKHHRHHLPPRGAKFTIGCTEDDRLAGVAVVGRPVARRLDDGWTAEVTRLCTDGTMHVASKLYAACWRAARAMGYRRLITYTLSSEAGTSLTAAGWRVLYQTRGGEWTRLLRPRIAKASTEPKTLWEVCA